MPERPGMQSRPTDPSRRPERVKAGRAGRALPFASGISDRAGVSRAGRVATTVHARLPGPVQSRSVVAPVGESVHTDRLGPIALKHMADQPLPAAAAESLQDENLAMVSPYSLRHQSDRGAVLDRMGGDSATEAAVRRALDWLAQVQEPDGRWQMEKYGGQRGHDPGATGLALLCYLGWGATHTEPGTYRENVQKAIEWLLANKKQNGDFRVPGSENAMYSQGIAALALAEAYGVTGDPGLKAPVQSAVDFIVNAQNPSDGGWRYYLQEPGDTSVFAWQIMALRSAKAAGLEVPDHTFLRARGWLEHVAGGHSGGLYGYRDRNPLPSLVAVGMFSRQMLGVEKDDPATRESVAYLQGIPLLLDEPYLPVFYQIYYRTLALYHYQGEAWTEWNRQMKLALVKAQQIEGEYPGSWDPRGLYARRCGRIVSTALATLTLEVYYRYLPLYTGMEALVGSGPQDIQ